MNRRAYILGYGQTKCRVFPDRDLRSLLSEAYVKALEYTGMDPKLIQQTYLGHYPIQSDMQMTCGQAFNQAIGLGPRVGCVEVEQACASSGIALHEAVMGVTSGKYDVVLCAGVAKTLDGMRTGAVGEGPWDESGFNPFCIHAGILYGVTHTNLSHEYFRKNNITVEDQAAWYVTEMWYATKHPNAYVYNQRIPTIEEHIDQGYRRYPELKGMGAINCDGASTIILATREVAKEYTDALIYIAGIAYKSTSMYGPHNLDNRYGVESCMREAYKEALLEAHVEPKDIDVLQPQDAEYKILIEWMEALKHPDIASGKAAKWFTDGQAYPGGKLPCCSLGAAKFGQPRGANYLNYNIENFMQLREECGSWQVPMKNYVGVATVSPGRSVVTVLRRER